MAHPWTFSTQGAATTVASGNLTLTNPSGSASGDLIVARIAYRGTANFTLPAGWTLCAQETSGNTIVNNSGGDSISSGLMAFIVRGGSVPSYVFTRTGGDVAQGYATRFPGPVAASPLGQVSSFTLAAGSTSLTAPGFTTTTSLELLVAMQADARAGVGGGFVAATDPAIAAVGAVTTDPDTQRWSARAGASSTTGADVGITISDAVKDTAGSTGTFSCSETLSARHVVIVASFKNAGADLTEERVSKVAGYAAIDTLGARDLQASKVAGYAAIDALGLRDLQVSKVAGYAVLASPPQLDVARLRAYAALTPSTDELVASRVRVYAGLTTSITELRVSRLRAYTALRPSPEAVGSASGTATVIGISPSVAVVRRRRATNVRFGTTALLNTAGSAAGTSTVIGVAVTGFSIGTAAGTSAVAGVGNVIAGSIGVAASTSTVSGVGSTGDLEAVGSAAGTSTATGVAPTSFGAASGTSTAAAVAYNDPFWSSVVLLLDCSGADASTSFTDLSPAANAVAAVGNAQIDTGIVKYGTGSILMDGTGDYLDVGASNDADFSVANATAITMDAWIYLSALGRTSTIMSSRPASSAHQFDFTVNGANTVSINAYRNGVAVSSASTTTTLTTGVWYYISAQRSGSVWTIWHNGVQEGTATESNTPSTATFGFNVGRTDFNTGRDFQGSIYNPRVTRAARYTGTFTPPTAPHPVQLPAGAGVGSSTGFSTAVGIASTGDGVGSAAGISTVTGVALVESAGRNIIFVRGL